MLEVILYVIIFVASNIVCWCTGYIKGERRGIRDTERRWSQAVNRTDSYDY